MYSSRKLLCQTNTRSLLHTQCQGTCKQKKTVNMIGPPDPVSNLHPIVYAVKENETPLEQKLRKHREKLQEWNSLFWTKHNINFKEQKKEFETEKLAKKGTTDEGLTADEISIFYKRFLDENRKTHMKYLFEWYQRTIYTTFLHFRVIIQNLYKKRCQSNNNKEMYMVKKCFIQWKTIA